LGIILEKIKGTVMYFVLCAKTLQRCFNVKQTIPYEERKTDQEKYYRRRRYGELGRGR
jgi:hypothetical protein